MAVSIEAIKELRALTGAGITNVKEALEASGGDIDKSVLYLREKGMAKGAKRADREANNGTVASYVHGGGSMAVIVELNAETDFASRDQKFKDLARDIALHVAAANPEYISIENVPVEILDRERELAKNDIDEKKPEEIKNKIIEGRLQRFYDDNVLLEQKYFKDDSKKIKDLISDLVSALGEKVEVGRMCRFQIGKPATYSTL